MGWKKSLTQIRKDAKNTSEATGIHHLVGLRSKTSLVKLQRKGQMVIPRSLREEAGVSEGTLIVVEGGKLF